MLRLIFLLSFALFWGGLTFYTGFAVRVAHAILSDPMEGGLITQRVTNILQVLGVILIPMMAWNAWNVFRTNRRFGMSLVVLAVLFSIAISGLYVVHGQLDQVIDADAYEIIDRAAFTAGHRRYNQLTAVEWIASLIYFSVTVFAWRAADRQSESRDGHGV